MPENTHQLQFFGAGVAVEMGQIQRELKKLWQASDQVATRASRLNLVIFNSGPSSIRANTALVEKITRQHALRAILIAAKPQLPGNHVRAWVNAHCQVSKSGTRQRCSEQIAFELTGEARQAGLTPNIVFAHLDSDLPLYLWRQGEFQSNGDQLMAWVDRLLFDSGDWANPAEQFKRVRQISAANALDDSLADLNWTRYAGLRSAVTQIFDAPEAGQALSQLDSVGITYAGGVGARTGALLVTGWLAARLGWKPAPAGKGTLAFVSANGREVTVQLDGSGDGETPQISHLSLRTAEGNEFAVSREVGSAFYTTRVRRNGREQSQVLPVGPQDLADLVSAELVHGGGHRTCLCALDLVEGVL
jgi:glucose-6-phosphate dehydrogenase assembly protein OpcA